MCKTMVNSFEEKRTFHQKIGQIDWGRCGSRDWAPMPSPCPRPDPGPGPHSPLIEANNALGQKSQETDSNAKGTFGTSEPACELIFVGHVGEAEQRTW